VTYRELMLLNRLGLVPRASAAPLSIFVETSTVGLPVVARSQVVWLFSSVQGQIPHDGSWVLPGAGLAEARGTTARIAFI